MAVVILSLLTEEGDASSLAQLGRSTRHRPERRPEAWESPVSGKDTVFK